MVTVQLVTWNSAKALPRTLESLAAIPEGGARFIVVDNNSEDESVKMVREALPRAEIIERGDNIGFGSAHNLGFNQAETEYVMLCNPDFIVDWEGVRKLVAEMDADKKLASVQGKIYRNDEVLDSVGVELTWALNGREVGAGEVDEGQYDQPREITAATGAAALLRLSSVNEVGGFDEDFFAYKGDVDLGWRLNKTGYTVKYFPVKMGVHPRAVRSEGFMGWGLNPLRVYMSITGPPNLFKRS